MKNSLKLNNDNLNVKCQNLTPCLYIVATPIGNLADMTFRAVETLKQVDLIAAEDTRHSKKLLQHYDINTPMISLHEHNEKEKYKILLDKLQQGKSIALISDAGTPLISDPGYRLVHEAIQLNITVIPIPGASALISALSVSGLPSDHFTFEGFLPAKESARKQLLGKLLNETRTMIFYESPHRLLDMLNNLLEIFGEEREVVIARELTKRFETIHGGTLQSMIKWLLENPEQQKGEFVILVAGADQAIEKDLSGDDLHVLNVLLSELSVKQASHLAAKIIGKKKNIFYKQALQIVGNKHG